MDLSKKLGAGTPAWIFGKKLFGTFLKKYASALVEGASADWAIPAGAFALYSAIGLESMAAKCHNAQTKQAFETDAKRRDYDNATAGSLASQ